MSILNQPVNAAVMDVELQPHVTIDVIKLVAPA